MDQGNVGFSKSAQRWGNLTVYVDDDDMLGGSDGKTVEIDHTIEGFWNLVKRGINGKYISVSQKHLQTYLGEFEFRYNLRKEPHLMLPLLMTSFTRGV